MRQALQVPHEIGMFFREDAARRGPQAVRFSGTLALGIWVSLPLTVRTQLLRWLAAEHWSGNKNPPAEQIWEQFTLILVDFLKVRLDVDRGRFIEGKPGATATFTEDEVKTMYKVVDALDYLLNIHEMELPAEPPPDEGVGWD